MSHTRRCRSPRTVEMPDLGCWARQIRAHHGWSRPQAAARLRLHPDTLKSVENHLSAPTPTTVDRIILGYGLDHAQARHTRELAAPPMDLTPLDHLRHRYATPAQQARLARLDREGIACAYLDPLWHTVIANQRFHHAFPGVDAYDGNLALWAFGDAATAAAPHRDHDCTFFTATLRAALGRHRTATGSHALLQHLRNNNTFRDTWTGTLAVAYGLTPANPLHRRDPDTGAPYSLRIQLGDTHTHDVRFYLAYRTPYNGPPLPPP
ncbi:helix-turn-helix domain-containing protein [Nocardia sp. alder85J]|uniref:helix-turn-helix domain-containing protein n=1 Tax=Nocardia sp. alder85J TaxID=2862949 RepID=UPI001CD3EDCF|nr:helix-turn-helix transcriptional regulator [Nocardia sp. alder85J]MCX4098348.1 helix-turn-helix transcriptional regulator [Nocardia sp. alder85J]